jgi:hypothetical protein
MVSEPVSVPPMHAGKTGVSDSVMHRPPNFLWQRAQPITVSLFTDRASKTDSKWYTKRLNHCVFFMVCTQFANAAASRIVRQVVLCGPRGRSFIAQMLTVCCQFAHTLRCADICVFQFVLSFDVICGRFM